MKENEQFNLELLLNILGPDILKQKWAKKIKNIPDKSSKATPDPVE